MSAYLHSSPSYDREGLSTIRFRLFAIPTSSIHPAIVRQLPVYKSD